MHAQGYSGRQRSGFTLTAIVAAHAAALVALALAKIHVAPEPPVTSLEIRDVPIDPPPPPEPLPQPKIDRREPQTQSTVTVIEPLIRTPSKGPEIAPAPSDTVTFTPYPIGPTTILPQPLPVPDPIVPPPPPEPKPVPVRLKPRGNPSSWVTNDDYPADALRSEEQGRTVFILTVGIDGKPSACNVAASSGSSILDGAACRLLMRRARFVPGTDADGNPAGGTYRNSFNWQIPEES